VKLDSPQFPNLTARLRSVQFGGRKPERIARLVGFNFLRRRQKMRTIMTKAALALAVPGLLASTVPAGAMPTSHSAVATHVATGSDTTWNDHGRHRGDERRRGYDGYGRSDRSDRYERYDQPVRSNTRIWRGENGQYYCRRDNGTTGLLIGGAVGGLIGNEVAGRGDRTLGIILGAAGGAILGRAIDRSNSRCR
jgi:Glycine zipper 2TM domain